jgi:hypothetical protein
VTITRLEDRGRLRDLSVKVASNMTEMRAKKLTLRYFRFSRRREDDCLKGYCASYFLEIEFAIALIMEAESISETSVNVHETIRRSITEGSYLQETSVT